MPRLGYKLMTEELGPRELVTCAVRAEEAGFEFAAISDHFFPWLDEQGHSPFAWSVLGAIATATERIGLMTAVTCPTLRYHPAIVAQAAATVSLLSNGRFRLGLGSGERLNEHVVGGGWPSVQIRQELLEEAVDIIRLLFEGRMASYEGQHIQLESARLFDLPDAPPEILLAAGGPQAARIAAEKADGLVASETDPDLVSVYRDAGGDGPCYVEVSMCWSQSEDEARETLHRYSRWSGLGWSVLAELPTPRAFDEASQSVRPEDVAEDTPHGPDTTRYVEAIGEAIDAGFDHVVLHQVGPKQSDFLRFFEQELMPAVRTQLRPFAEEERATS
ncbi:MAG: LLM class F420-dependent oxidoreductase [Proteobacteria bacterium]|nr:MAG: LLM class F420-dependent oxidoreductase [Pseudomonadota bacterium]